MVKTRIKRVLFTLLTVTLFVPVGHSPPVQAASQAECGIWLCLPTGFGQGCSASKRAFKKRVKRFKPPLPRFSSCVVQTDAVPNAPTFTSKSGFAAHISSYRECVRTKEVRHRKDDTRTVCADGRTIPSRIGKDTKCRFLGAGSLEERGRVPKHCTKTMRYTEVYRDGQRFGKTHYY